MKPELDDLLNSAKNLSAEDQQLAIEQMLASQHKNLTFPRFFEKKFIKSYQKRSAHQIQLALIIPLFVFVLSFYFDFFFVPDWHRAAQIRFLFVIPICTILTSLAFSRFFLPLQQFLLTASILTITIGILALAYSEQNPMKDMYYNALLLIEIWIFTLARLRFWNSVFCAVCIIFFFNLFFFFEPERDAYLIQAHNYLYVSGAIIGLLVSYLNEKNFRKNYLIGRLIEVKNSILNDLAHRDPLTQILNRRGFDRTLGTQLRQAKRNGYILSLFLVDIDFFGDFNKSYGHFEGDRTLTAIAQMLNKFPRREGDIVARLGGDQFAILLNDIRFNQVERTAERIRHTVLDLKIPHENSKVHERITVSVGVAAIKPDVTIRSRKLMELAESALYRAKTRGRNCAEIYRDL